MGNPMYCTMTIIDGYTETALYSTLAAAEEAARELAEDGCTCQVLELLSTIQPAPQPPLEVAYGVRPGVDFPATLNL